MQQYLALAPEVIIVIAAIAALFADRLGGDRVAALIGFVGTALAAALVWMAPTPDLLFGDLMSLSAEPPVQMLRSLVVVLTGLFLLWVAARGWQGRRAREAVSLVLFSTVGSMLLISATDMIVLFLALELSTMPLYVLLGYVPGDRRGYEGALKYFLLSVLTSLVLAYGLSFAYGLTGETSYGAADLTDAGALGAVAAFMIVVGFLTKMTAVPFHFWAPDASEGASTTSAAFVSSIAKVAPMWALVRILVDVLPEGEALSSAIIVTAVLSMTLGILAAIVQSDIRRMIAYSGISNAGFMMLGVAAATSEGYAGAVLLVVMYSIATLGLLLAVAQEGATLADVAGLVRRRPYAAWSSVGFLFSIIGFPPMIGFYGKLAVFSAALDAGYTWPVVLALLLSVVAGGYAFNVIRAMFTPGEGAPEEVERDPIEVTSSYPQIPGLAAFVILVLAIATIALGLATEPVLRLLGTVLV